MSDVLSFAEIDGQHVELLPARTVLSLFSTGSCGCTASTAATGATGATSAGATGQGVTTGAGGPGEGKAGIYDSWFYFEDSPSTINVIGGAGGAGGAVSGAPTAG